MQPKPVVIHHGHSFSTTVYMARLVHRVRHVSNSREAMDMIPTRGSRGTTSAHTSLEEAAL